MPNIDAPAARFLSLDVFRGMTVCFMIIVNMPGTGAIPFAPLHHAVWHGFTATDLVMPSFLFAVGNAMSFTKKKYESGDRILGKIFKRTALIFILGYLLYWFPYFQTDGSGGLMLKPIGETRIMGVLQRIALCYLLASLIIHYLSEKKIVILSILFLIGYWIILLVFGDPADPFSMLGNAGHYIDKFVLGEKHLSTRLGPPFEYYGLLSTIPATVLVIAGYFTGKFIQQKGKNYESISKLMLSGCLLIFIGLCWDSIFPINQKLWSSSLILLCTGLDLVIISALLYIIEIKQWTSRPNWTYFFVVFGKNPLFIYLLSEVASRVFNMIFLRNGMNIYTAANTNFFQIIAPGPVGSLLFAISFMLMCWLVGFWMDKKSVYVRV